jgi:hypothetical protein
MTQAEYDSLRDAGALDPLGCYCIQIDVSARDGIISRIRRLLRLIGVSDLKIKMRFAV